MRCFRLRKDHPLGQNTVRTCPFECGVCGKLDHLSDQLCPHIYGTIGQFYRRFGVNRQHFPKTSHRIPQSWAREQLYERGYIERGSLSGEGVPIFTEKAWSLRQRQRPYARTDLHRPAIPDRWHTAPSTNQQGKDRQSTNQRNQRSQSSVKHLHT